MFRKSKWVSLLSAMMIGVLFFLAVTAVLLISGVLSLNKTNLTFTTDSVEALYVSLSHQLQCFFCGNLLGRFFAFSDSVTDNVAVEHYVNFKTLVVVGSAFTL